MFVNYKTQVICKIGSRSWRDDGFLGLCCYLYVTWLASQLPREHLGYLNVKNKFFICKLRPRLIRKIGSRSDSYRTADQHQCDKYYECNIKGEESTNLCPDGLVFDIYTQGSILRNSIEAKMFWTNFLSYSNSTRHNFLALTAPKSNK
jgi:hypothetical protein